MQDFGIMKERDAKFYVACAMLILEHLHERSIVHRDLRPESFRLDEHGYLKLVEVGTAKIVSNRTYTIVGTPHYMAPEALLGKGYNFTADMWSVGIMLFEMMTGILPFAEETNDPYEVYQSVIRDKLVYPHFLLRQVNAKRMIDLLLTRHNPSLRGDPASIMSSTFFTSLKWEDLLSKTIKAPHAPNSVPENFSTTESIGKLVDVIAEGELGDRRNPKKKIHKNWDSCF
jgi:cGMP-dependent protein kinase